MNELSTKQKLLLSQLVADWLKLPTLQQVFEKTETRAESHFVETAREVSAPMFRAKTEQHLREVIPLEYPDADVQSLTQQIMDELSLYGSR